MNTSGKVALVTGGGTRVGRQIGIELVSVGFDLAIHYRRSELAARALQAEIEQIGRRAMLVSGDLAEPGTPARLVAEVVEGLGGVDVLVNNAASFDRLPFEQTDAQHWERTFTVNTLAPAMLARTAAPVMRSRGQGCIINLLDILADRAVRGYASYVSSKAALAAITRCLALELAPQITVNGVAPGIAEFPDEYDQAKRDRLIQRVPLGRAGSPLDVARLVRFLVTEGDYITGAIIPVDGGRSICL